MKELSGPSVPTSSALATRTRSQITATKEAEKNKNNEIDDVATWLKKNPEIVENHLSTAMYPGSQTPIIEMLKNPGEDMTQADMAAQVLNQLAGMARETSTDALYVWHYVEHHSLWNTHRNENLRSAEAFLTNLADAFGVRALFSVATVSQKECRRYINHLNKQWGPEWFTTLLQAKVFAPHIKSVENLPRELLQQMAGNCQQGQYNTVHEALVAYNNQIFLRTNPQERRKSGTRKLKTPHLQPMDASAMNVARNEANKDNRIHDWVAARYRGGESTVG